MRGFTLNLFPITWLRAMYCSLSSFEARTLSANIEIGFHMSERAGTCHWLLRSTHVVIRPLAHIQRD